MIRLTCVSPRFGEHTLTSEGGVIRIGRSPGSDVRFEGDVEAFVALHHAEIVFENGAYFLWATDDEKRVWVNGAKTTKRALSTGDEIRLGAADGPEVRVEFVGVRKTKTRSGLIVPPKVAAKSAPRSKVQNARPSQVVPLPARKSKAVAALPPDEDVTRMHVHTQRASASAIPVPSAPLPVLGVPLGDGELDSVMSKVAREVAKARGLRKGVASGRTMVIMASAMKSIRLMADKRTRKWKRTLAGAVAFGGAMVLGLFAVIWFQQQRIGALVTEKTNIDSQIQTIFHEMSTETDDEKLAVLESRLETLMGRATDTLVEVRRRNERKATELAEPVDELEIDIRKILKSFGAETYAIPPIFKQALREQLDELKASPTLPLAFAKKRRYWPMIQKAFASKQLPEELGYIAFTESRFDPTAVNAKTQATGMWQFMEEAARNCGLTVDGKRDDRKDPYASSMGAACHLSKLMIEFGEQSFMLAVASYNRGENGVRRALHRVAREPGGYRKRDFWQLYRMKLLPEETRDYVPRVLAAAIVLGNPGKYDLKSRGEAPPAVSASSSSASGAR